MGNMMDRRILGYTIFGQPHKGLNQGYLCLRLPSSIHFYLLLENLRIFIHFEVSNTNDLLVEHAKPMSPFKNICFSPSEKESETMSRTSCTPWHPMVTLLEVCVLSPLRGSAAPRTPADSYMPRWCPQLRPENQFGSSPIDGSCAADRCRDDLVDIASGFLRVGLNERERIWCWINNWIRPSLVGKLLVAPWLPMLKEIWTLLALSSLPTIGLVWLQMWLISGGLASNKLFHWMRMIILAFPTSLFSHIYQLVILLVSIYPSAW